MYGPRNRNNPAPRIPGIRSIPPYRLQGSYIIAAIKSEESSVIPFPSAKDRPSHLWFGKDEGN